jgi:hypothetical protein
MRRSQAARIYLKTGNLREGIRNASQFGNRVSIGAFNSLLKTPRPKFAIA